MTVYYIKVAWNIISQILNIAGRCFLVLLSLGVSATILLTIELTIARIISYDIILKNQFFKFVVITCLAVGIICAIICGKALF